MKLFKKPHFKLRPRRDLTSHAQRITIKPVDSTAGASLRRPGARYDVADELGGFGDQLANTTRADGLKHARSARMGEARTNIAARAASHVLDEHRKLVTSSLHAYDQAVRDLLHFVRRTPHSRRRYEITRWVLLLGDTAGIWGAAIYMGELPLLAAGQAVAAGTAAVTAGQVGADVRELRLARQRRIIAQEDTFPAELLQRYPRLFSDPQPCPGTYGLALKIALLVMLTLAVSVFALRATIEGSAGLVFGALALATSAASFINSWTYADDIADLLEVYAQELQRTLGLHRGLANDPAIAEHSAATAEVASVEEEHELRAVAQSDHARALTHEVYRRNPQVFGHGTRASRSHAPDNSSRCDDFEVEQLHPDLNRPDLPDVPSSLGGR